MKRLTLAVALGLLASCGPEAAEDNYEDSPAALRLAEMLADPEGTGADCQDVGEARDCYWSNALQLSNMGVISLTQRSEQDYTLVISQSPYGIEAFTGVAHEPGPHFWAIENGVLAGHYVQNVPLTLPSSVQLNLRSAAAHERLR